MKRTIIDKLLPYCQALDSKHEMLCEKLCSYLEARKKGEPLGNKLSCWRNFPYRSVGNKISDLW